MSLGLLLLIVVVIVLIGGMPNVGVPHEYGYFPSGIATVVLVLLLVALFTHRI